MSKPGFASTGDIKAKKITFSEVGPGLHAFTAEGDPNSGIIIGDDGCIVMDAQATPAMASLVIERVRQVTDKPIKYVVLSHYHAVRVLGARKRDASSPSVASRIGIRNTADFRGCSRMRNRSQVSPGRMSLSLAS
jgi:glyoxylase-like metal-dependent hydrolase (beta-lactamase superfamily II)